MGPNLQSIVNNHKIIVKSSQLCRIFVVIFRTIF